MPPKLHTRNLSAYGPETLMRFWSWAFFTSTETDYLKPRACTVSFEV